MILFFQGHVYFSRESDEGKKGLIENRCINKIDVLVSILSKQKASYIKALAYYTIIPRNDQKDHDNSEKLFAK